MSVLSVAGDGHARGSGPISIPAVTRQHVKRRLLAHAAGASWLTAAVITARWPDVGEWGRGPELTAIAAGLGAVLIAAGVISLGFASVAARVQRASPWLLALGIFFSVWQVFTAKTGTLPQPFFPPPHVLLEVFTDDYLKLLESVVASVKLELLGFAYGAGCGFLIGVSLGWSKAFGYWVHPIMRFIGPLPSIAWLAYRAGHIPGAWFVSAVHLAEDIAKLPGGGPIVLTSLDGLLALDNLAEAQTGTSRAIHVLEGGTAAWLTAGFGVETGGEHWVSQPNDVYKRPYEGTDNAREAMQGYIDWELQLVAQLANDGVANFHVVRG